MPYFHEEGTGYPTPEFKEFEKQLTGIVIELWNKHHSYMEIWNDLCGWYQSYDILKSLGPSNLGGCAEVELSPCESEFHTIVAEWISRGYSGHEIRIAALDVAMWVEINVRLGHVEYED